MPRERVLWRQGNGPKPPNRCHDRTPAPTWDPVAAKVLEIPGVGTREGPGVGTRGCFFGHPAVGCRSLLKTCGKGLMDNHDLGLPHLGVLIAG